MHDGFMHIERDLRYARVLFYYFLFFPHIYYLDMISDELYT